MMSSSKYGQYINSVLNLRNRNKNRDGEIQMENHDWTNDIKLKPSPVLIDSEQSSFEETLGIVSNKDDPEMLCLTFRSCVIGVFFIIIISSINTYFSYRSQIFAFAKEIFILLAYLIGKFFVLIMPKHQWFNGHWYSFSFNPGAFTVKEHTLIFIMAHISAEYLYSCDLFVIMYYIKTEDKPPMPHYLVGLILVLCAQLLGYSLAGILRRILVWPSEMVWIWIFPYMTAFRTMNEKESPLSFRWLGLTRRRFFVIILVFAFVYHWFPGFIFPKLDSFPWWCSINQNSTILSQLTGPAGLAMGLVSLNCNRYFFYHMSPLTQPWWAYVNMIVGFILVGWILVIILYYSNVANWAKLPIIGSGYIYLSPNDKNTIQLSAVPAIMLHLYFGVFIALFIHTFLYHGRSILKYFRTSLKNRQNDVHCTLISQYKEVSEWVYGILFLLTFVGACLICHFCGLLPWYYVLLAVALSAAFAIPTAILQAQAAIYVSTELALRLLGIFLFNNDPILTITFFIFSYSTQSQALLLLQSLKLGHYMKISPRILFLIQLISTIISSTTAYIIVRYLISNEKDFCIGDDWNCNDLLGPLGGTSSSDRSTLFGLKSVYPWLFWMMLAIGVLPIFTWIAQRLFSSIRWIKRVHIPVMFVYFVSLVSPNYGYVIAPGWLLLGVIFRKIIPRWWFDRYAFLFQICIFMGTFAASFFIFFIFTYNDIKFPAWWGTQTDICPLAFANVDGNYSENYF